MRRNEAIIICATEKALDAQFTNSTLWIGETLSEKIDAAARAQSALQSHGSRLQALKGIYSEAEKLGYSRENIQDLKAVIGILEVRGVALASAVHGVTNVNASVDGEQQLTSDQVFSLAATDLFVEKAQLALTRRSDRLYNSGRWSMMGTFLLLAGAAGFVAFQLSHPISGDIPNNTLILRIFQATALSAFVLVGVKYLVSLGRSFFHEANTLRDRRHALRFGRLYVYLKRGHVDLEDLEKAFNWNAITTSSFLDMKPEMVAETLLHKIIDAFGKLPADTAKALANAIATVRNK